MIDHIAALIFNEKRGILCNPTLKLKIIPDLNRDGFFK